MIQSVILEVKAKPGSKQSSIKLVENKIIASLSSQPVDGEANKELVRILSKSLKLTQKQIEVKVGATSKIKLVKVTSDFTKEELLSKLE